VNEQRTPTARQEGRQAGGQTGRKGGSCKSDSFFFFFFFVFFFFFPEVAKQRGSRFDKSSQFARVDN
jgi:hypothetical protein